MVTRFSCLQKRKLLAFEYSRYFCAAGYPEKEGWIFFKWPRMFQPSSINWVGCGRSQRIRISHDSLRRASLTPHQFYPTPEALAERLVREARFQDGHRRLEPGTGTGAIASCNPSAAVSCVEISPLHSRVLAALGLTLHTANFL